MRPSTVVKTYLSHSLCSSGQSIKLVLLAVAIVSGTSAISGAFASEYSDGFRAYVEGDYQAAREYWREAARGNDAKSMFNLGLLHEQSKLPDANYQQAERWFRLAADNGYVAADYHLAQRMLERGGSDDEALNLIKNAADKGYAPAKRYLGGGSKLVINTAKQPSASSSKASSFQSESWINRQRPSHWTIQLLAFKERSKVYQFIQDHGLQSNAAYFVERSNGEVFYKLVYGAYSSKDKATFARQNLSEDLQEFGPWLRTISSVQAITKR